MRISGRRIHIAGSASRVTDPELIHRAHAVVATLTDEVLAGGGSLVVGVGREPRVQEDESSPSLIFDWTVLERLGAHISERGVGLPSSGTLVYTVASSKTEAQIPAHRSALWRQLKQSGVVHLEFLDSGWSSGAVRRQRQEALGDVLVVLGGGEGVEQLAELYVSSGKPVIPLDLPLGAATEDGSGGALRLNGTALAAPQEFLRFDDRSQAGVLLSDLNTARGTRPVREVVKAILRLIEALSSPRAFYVRLLNLEIEECQAVERFFRRVVDPVVEGLGYAPYETGRNRSEFAWMNEEIFEGLHYSTLVIADVTGARPNCYMELGYALGRGLRVLVTAMGGTHPPFDSQMIPHHFWDDLGHDVDRQVAFREFWTRYVDRPPLVRPRANL